MKPGTNITQAQAEMDLIGRQLASGEYKLRILE